MAIHHRLLHWVQAAIRLSQILDGEQGLAIERRQKLNARIDRLHPDLPVAKIPDHDRACTAIALRTTFLGACPTKRFPQIIEHCPGWVSGNDCDYISAK